MTTESLIALWDRGGSAILILVGVGLLMRYMLGRVVKAFDDLVAAHRESTKYLSESFTELSGSLLLLTERISRVEGKVEAFGMMAVRGGKFTRPPTGQGDQARDDAVRAAEDAVAQVFEGPNTGVHEIPTSPRTPLARASKLPTPAKGIVPFGPGYRPPQKGK